MNKRKSETVFKCDYCGSITSYFVATAEYKHFCLEQVPGYPASKDCMTDYLKILKIKLLPFLYQTQFINQISTINFFNWINYLFATILILTPSKTPESHADYKVVVCMIIDT